MVNMLSTLRLSLLPLVFSISCQSTGGGVKVWENIPEDSAKPLNGFFRSNGEEKMTYGEAAHYYAVSPSDMEYILNKLKQCLDPKPTIDNKSIIDLLLNNK